MNANEAALLALLKRLSSRCNDDSLKAEFQIFFCPECCLQQPGHESFCELKAQIDRLEAEQLAFLNHKEQQNDQ